MDAPAPTLDVLLAIDERLARIERELLALREDVDALHVSLRGGRPAVSATVTDAAAADARAADVLAGPAERLVAFAARLSLTAQDRVDAVLARRRAAGHGHPGSGRAERLRRRVADARRAAVRDAAAVRTAVRTAARTAAGAAGSRLAANGAVSGVVRVVAGVAVVGVVAVQVLGIGRPSEDRSTPPPAPPAAAGEEQGAASRGSTSPSPSAATTTPAAPAVPSARPAVPDVRPASQRIAPPVSLRVPAIEVDARVVVVGLEPDGAMEIPADVRTVGWYDPFEGLGVAPGEPGTAVIAGHVDSRTQGRGAFWPLRELTRGDVIEVAHADGTVTRWRVESVVRHPKTDIPIDDIFTFDGDERLALITCGGEFDRSAGAYLDNYVVTAVPAGPAVGGAGQTLPTAP